MSDEQNKAFIEKGAVLEHARWARWQKYVFGLSLENEDGSLTIPAWAVNRWKRQIELSYADLTEEEKESDRKETRNYLPLVKEMLERLNITALLRRRVEAHFKHFPKTDCVRLGMEQILDELEKKTAEEATQ